MDCGHHGDVDLADGHSRCTCEFSILVTTSPGMVQAAFSRPHDEDRNASEACLSRLNVSDDDRAMLIDKTAALARWERGSKDEGPAAGPQTSWFAQGPLQGEQNPWRDSEHEKTCDDQCARREKDLVAFLFNPSLHSVSSSRRSTDQPNPQRPRLFPWQRQRR